MLIDELRSLNLEGAILNDTETKEKFSKDASIFQIQPEVVIQPKNSSDLSKLVNFVTKNKGRYDDLSLTPRAAGTCMSGGPINSSIILDFTAHFNNIQEIGNDFTILEPGVYYHDFEPKADEKGLMLPPFPASKALCALGGMVANNSAGEKTLSYGKMEDFVQELSVIFADGKEYTLKPLNKVELEEKMALLTFEGKLYKNIYNLIEKNHNLLHAAKPKVSKNSAGYTLWNVWNEDKTIFDLNKLIVGSQGTLGIITKMKLRLVPIKKHSRLVVVNLKDLKHLGEIVNTVLPFKPESFESFDIYTLKTALRYLPDILKAMKPANIFKLAWQFLPEIGMAITGNIPHMILLIEFVELTEEEAAEKAREVQSALAKFHDMTQIMNEKQAEKFWTLRHESFNVLRKHFKTVHAAPFIDDIIVRPEYLPEFLPKLDKILKAHELVYTVAGHVGNGNFHIIPLMDFKSPEIVNELTSLSNEVYALVLNYHGSITAEHNDGLVRTPFLEMMYGSKVYDLFEETKRIFDPLNIFNPKKKVGGTWKYSTEHLIKE
jgi:FAD/FMN-containing dehydrogenase